MLSPISRAIGLALLGVVALGQKVTPVEKVITLLEDMKSDVEQDGKDEASSYSKFSCFCKDSTATKSKSITDGQDTIDKLSADIAEDTATKAAEETKLQEAQAKKEKLSKDLEDNTVRCAKEKAEYEAIAADLTKAISSLVSAKKAMADKKTAIDAVALLDIGTSMKETLELAEAMGLTKAPRQKATSAFLQKQDPDKAYE